MLELTRIVLLEGENADKNVETDFRFGVFLT